MIYTWTQTIGTTTTTLPYTSSNISIGLGANQSISFTVSTTSECCPFQRTFAFFNSGSHWLPTTGNGGTGANHIYPNPTSDMITSMFDYSGLSVGTRKEIEVIDLMGKIVLHLSEITDDHCEISIGKLSSGTYWVRINDGQQVQTFNIQKL